MTRSEKEAVLKQILSDAILMCRQRQKHNIAGEHYYYTGLCMPLNIVWEALIIKIAMLDPYRCLYVEDMFPKLFEKIKKDLGRRNYLFPVDAAGYESRKAYVKDLIENVHKYV
jgi:hypothetical protein